ncbi:MAG: iron-sulfur cluster assembly protein [Parasphingorhabdus sp.]|jgi:iron-sulfur cluster assembly protein
MSIKLTETAVAQIKQSAVDGGMQNIPIRIAAKRSADGSIEYAMGFDEENDADTTREYDGLLLVVAPHSIDLLSGAILDYVAMENDQQQFVFLNPNDPNYIPPAEA